jgi:hypothetical protein
MSTVGQGAKGLRRFLQGKGSLSHEDAGRSSHPWTAPAFQSACRMECITMLAVPLANGRSAMMQWAQRTSEYM